MRNDKGFTLVEVLIVIAIIGILAAIAVPNMTNLVRKNRIENQTKRIYDDLQNARVRAMNNNRMHFFRIVGTSVEIYADTSNATDATYETYDGGDTRVLQRGGPDKVPFTFSGAVPADEDVGGGLVSFNGRGLASQQGTVCVGDATVITQPAVNCVVVSLTRIKLGQISTANIAAGNCSGYCNEIP